MGFQIGTGGKADQIFGSVTDGTWVAPLPGYRAAFIPKTNPAPYAGIYAMIIHGSDKHTSAPAGDGFGTVRVNSGDVIRFAGALADGTPVSQGALLSQNGLWPLCISLYSGKGLVAGRIGFTNQASSHLSGSLSWIKLSGSWARYCPGGFTNECGGLGSAYLSTDSILNLTNASVIFSGDNSSPGFTNSVTPGSNGKILSPDPHQLSMSISRLSGTFRGSTTDPSNGSSLSFRGAVLQKLNAGYGYLLGSGQNGEVILAQQVFLAILNRSCIGKGW